MTRRTLASRGFILPAAPPKVGSRVFDTGEWNALNLRKAVLDFLLPGNKFVVSNRADIQSFGRIVDTAAEYDGFGKRMYRAMGRADDRERVAAWLGIEPHIIWPRRFAQCPAIQAPTRFLPIEQWKAPPRQPWDDWKDAARQLWGATGKLIRYLAGGEA